MPVPRASAQSPTTEPALPDLVIQHLAIELQTGGACNFTSTTLGMSVIVANIGHAPAGGFVVQVSGIAQQDPAQQTVAGLAQGQQTRLWFRGGNGPGTPTTAVVDPLDQVHESNESNNQVTEFVPIPTLPPTCTPTPAPITSPTATRTPTPTPVVAASFTLSASTTSVEVGQTLTLTATLRNESSAGVVFAPLVYDLRPNGTIAQSGPLFPEQQTPGGPSLSPGQSTTVTFTVIAVRPGTITPSIGAFAYEVCYFGNCVLGGLGRSASAPPITVAPPARTQGLGLGSFTATTVPASTADSQSGSGQANGPGSLVLTWRPGSLQSGYRVLQLAPNDSRVLPATGSLSADATGLVVPTQGLTGLSCYILMAIGPGDTLLGYSDPLCVFPGSGHNPSRAGLFTMTVPRAGTFSIAYATSNPDPVTSRYYWLVGGPIVPATAGPAAIPALGPACIASAVRDGVFYYDDVLCTMPGVASPDTPA